MASANMSKDVNRTGTNEVALSDTCRIELTHLPNGVARSSLDEKHFVVKQYQVDQIVQEVKGCFGAPTIQIIDYNHGEIVKKTTRNVSDFATKSSEITPVAPLTRAGSDYGTSLGRNIYNKAYGSHEEREITVYSKVTKHDEESYHLHATATDSITTIVGALVGAGIGAFLGPIIEIPALVASIVSSLGGSIAGGAIGILIDDSVSVDATYYTLTGYHAPTNYHSPGYDGVARLVKTQSHSAYNKWFYEGFTPHNWDDGPLANILYLGTFGGTYPYVKEYQ